MRLTYPEQRRLISKQNQFIGLLKGRIRQLAEQVVREKSKVKVVVRVPEEATTYHALLALVKAINSAVGDEWRDEINHAYAPALKLVGLPDE